jgi:hypothetical protein
MHADRQVTSVPSVQSTFPLAAPAGQVAGCGKPESVPASLLHGMSTHASSMPPLAAVQVQKLVWAPLVPAVHAVWQV